MSSHVLVHLGCDRGVERFTGERERARVAGDEPDRGGALRRLAAAREREHALARVDAVDRAATAHLGRHLAGQESQPRPDVQHVLALPERQSRAYGMTLLDDIARHVCRFGPPRRLLVELEHGAHPTIFSASPRTLNLTGREMHERMVESSAG